MSGIPAGAIVHVGGKTVLNRLQTVGLQDPRVPTETVYETGNNLVVGKVLTEPDFRFQMTSWDVSTDLMALLCGETAAAIGDQISAADPAGTIYRWENVGPINLTSPWKSNTGSQGGSIEAGVIVPNLFPTALSYRLGVTENAEMQVTLATGSYFMSKAMPLEEYATGNGTTKTFQTANPARVYRIGGAGSTLYSHVFGVMVDGVQQIPGIDYTESGGANPEATGAQVATLSAALATGAAITSLAVTALSAPLSAGEQFIVTSGANTQTFTASAAVASGATAIPIDSATPNFAYPIGSTVTPTTGMTPVTISFALAPASGAVVKYCYFSDTAAAIPQSMNLDTAVVPAAVRGRDITLLVGDPSASPLALYGVQSFELQASTSGALQRQMGTQDPVGYNVTGVDCTGTVTLEPSSIDKLFQFLASTMGVDESEVYGYINQYQFPLTAVIHDPQNPSNIIKSIGVSDAFFQAPGENARVQTVTQFPITWESESGTFFEVKGALPA